MAPRVFRRLEKKPAGGEKLLFSVIRIGLLTNQTAES
jgi:hypothetical protein